MIEVKTPNSDELSLKVYGYVKPITPAQLNEFIDRACATIEQQEMEGYKLEEHYQEDELTLDELQTGLEI